MELVARFKSSSPKRILSLDGGGIRGALTLGYLEKLESILRTRHGNQNLLLSDYFDLIGGTSTGSIIAACLAKGMSVEEVKNKYLTLGGKIFSKKYYWVTNFRKRIRADFNNKVLIQELKNEFGDLTIGSNELRTGLCIVLKRADTNSTWFLLNHPEGKYYEHNKNILIWSALTAASAAPSYFLPQSLHVGKNEIGCFIDGGVSLSNNPSLGLLQVATLQGFPFKWKTGEDNLLLVSIGTGYGNLEMIPSEMIAKGKLFWAHNIADFYMQDASWENQAILQWMSSSPTSKRIDSMRGQLDHDLITGNPIISYLRYNFEISTNNLNDLKLRETFHAKNFLSKEVKCILEMSNANNRHLLYEIGKAASMEMLESHFDKVFNLDM